MRWSVPRAALGSTLVTKPALTDELPEGSNPFWRFSLRFYSQPGVPAACLDLQDRAGWDVNLLLFALWAGSDCAASLSLVELDRIDGEIAHWRAEVVRPLRQIRRRVKGEDSALYDRLKADELKAEHIQQTRMWQFSGLSPRVTTVDAALAAAAANLDLLLAKGIVTDADCQARSALLAALRDLLADQSRSI